MKFLGSKTGLKSEILAKLAYGPPYRFYANEPCTCFKHIKAFVVLFKHIEALTEWPCGYWPCAYKNECIVNGHP